MYSFDSTSLRNWFLKSKRELPWRQNLQGGDLDPYAVWVSEVMLQQTQVSVVIPYFEKWMMQFPTIKALADSSLEEVIKAWEGLGYYSRARNLHEGAKYVLEEHHGVLPSSDQELSKIKGLGHYTIGAIRSFAFKYKAAAVDGNVIRVISRYFEIRSDISKSKTLAEFRSIADHILPDQEPWVIAEALIELGATVCTKKPKCSQCPLNNSCKAFLSGEELTLPVKTKKIQIEKIYRDVAIIISEGRCLIRKIGKGKIMSDLHEFPYFESHPESPPKKELEKQVFDHLKLPAKLQSSLEQVEHGFTRYRVLLRAHIFVPELSIDLDDYFWHPIENLSNLPFSSGHKRILQLLQTP